MKFYRVQRISGKMPPPYMGVAWPLYDKGIDGWLLLPVGVNLIAIFLRWIWLNVRNPYWRRRRWFPKVEQHRHYLIIHV